MDNHFERLGFSLVRRPTTGSTHGKSMWRSLKVIQTHTHTHKKGHNPSSYIGDHYLSIESNVIAIHFFRVCYYWWPTKSELGWSSLEEFYRTLINAWMGEDVWFYWRWKILFWVRQYRWPTRSDMWWSPSEEFNWASINACMWEDIVWFYWRGKDWWWDNSKKYKSQDYGRLDRKITTPPWL